MKEKMIQYSGYESSQFMASYNYTYSCESYGCDDEGICRCGTYEDYDVTHYTKEIVQAMAHKISDKDYDPYSMDSVGSGSEFLTLIDSLIYASENYYGDDSELASTVPELYKLDKSLANATNNYKLQGKIKKYLEGVIIELIKTDIDLFERMGLFDSRNYEYPEPQGDYYGEELSEWKVSLNVKNFIIFKSILKLKLNSSGIKGL